MDTTTCDSPTCPGRPSTEEMFEDYQGRTVHLACAADLHEDDEQAMLEGRYDGTAYGNRMPD